MEQLLALPGLKSLRISSIEESEIDDHLIKLLIEKPNLAKHLHIPLQSGSNHILKLMNRKYTREKFIKRIKEIKAQVPDIMISSDVIVGFLRKVNKILWIHIIYVPNALICFTFSLFRSSWNVTATMEGQIPTDIKKPAQNA